MNNPNIPPSESALKESGEERNEEETEGHITHQPIKIDTIYILICQLKTSCCNEKHKRRENGYATCI
jgi:hypothetical protein